MEETIALAASALWLGVATSISPCPLVTNIAAISYIGKDVESPRRVLVSGLLYTVGRAIAYIGLGVLLVESLVRAPRVSQFLGSFLNVALGPLLVVVGMILLGLLGWSGGGGFGVKMAERAHRLGAFGAVFIGFLFALSFCPVSAGFFFGGLIPLAVKQGSSVLLPTLYGVGTALPVIGFAVLIATGAGSLGKAFQKASVVGTWARLATGGVFVVIGIYISMVYVYEVL